MFSTTIKRSVATLGVAAGLLAAAVPASAQIAPGSMGVKPPSTEQLTNLQTQELKAPTNAGTQVGSEGVKADNLRGEAIDIIP